MSVHDPLGPQPQEPGTPVPQPGGPPEPPTPILPEPGGEPVPLDPPAEPSPA